VGLWIVVRVVEGKKFCSLQIVFHFLPHSNKVIFKLSLVAFAQLEKVTINFVLSVRQTGKKEQMTPAGRIVVTEQ